MLSIATDYRADTGDASPYLERIAAAGFSHIHWCHEWNSSYVYSPAEIQKIGNRIRALGLKLLDLHGSCCDDADWASADETSRRKGVDLVKNRLAMTATLGGDAVVMHVPGPAAPPEPLFKSLDECFDFCASLGVRIAVENGSWPVLASVFERYCVEPVGLCYDCGHGNFDGEGLDRLAQYKNRLVAVHLHDNNGTYDLHQLPFMGTVDWPRLAQLLATSSYAKCLNFEVGMYNSGIADESVFLAEAFKRGERFAVIVEGE
jgi:sugar phosphate isomerase/epimerase